MQAPGSRNLKPRQRVVLAIVLTALLAGLAVGVAVTAPGGDHEDEVVAAAPDECLERWNSDEAALSYARHNRTFHRYTEAQVGYMPEDGTSTTISDDPTDGSCVVVFARSTLDPELAAAGQIARGGSWVPLTDIIAVSDLAALQSAALGSANAEPTEQGELTPP